MEQAPLKNRAARKEMEPGKEMEAAWQTQTRAQPKPNPSPRPGNEKTGHFVRVFLIDSFPLTPLAVWDKWRTVFMSKKSANKGTGKKLLALLVVLAAAGGGAAAWWYSGIVAVSTAAAADKDIIRVVTDTATIQSKNAVQIASKAGGLVERVYVEEGERVPKGRLLLVSDASSAALNVAGIKAQAAGVQAQLDTARDLAEKNKKLYAEGAISQDACIQSETAVKQLEAQLQALDYNAASVRQTTEGGRVTAPVAGLVTQVYVKEGETIQPGQPVLELSGIGDAYAEVNLIAEDADLVKEGMKAILSNDKDEVLVDNAVVRSVAPKAQDIISQLGISQKRVKVEIALPENSGLRLGADVKIQVEKRSGALSVPEKAVFELDGQDCVYVAEDGKALLRKVKIGLEGEDDVEILSGLSPGQLVILSPGADVEEGTRIKLK